MNRPVAWFAGAFAAGMFAAAKGLPFGFAIPILFAALGSILCMRGASEKFGRIPSVLLIAFAAGALVWIAQNPGEIGDPLSRLAANNPEVKDWTLEGTVRLFGLEAFEQDQRYFLVDVDTATFAGGAVKVRGGVAVNWKNGGDAHVFAGDRIRVRGKLAINLSHVNFGVESYEDYLRARGIHSAITSWNRDSVSVLSRGPRWSPSHLASRFRETMTERLDAVLPDSVKPFVFAVWLGRRTSMDNEQYMRYVNSGTVHILSVSGIHTGMLYVSLAYVLRVFTRISRRRRAMFTLFGVILFTLMTGVRLSSLRSAVVAGMYGLSEFFDREPDAPTALSVSGMALIAFDPKAMFDPGFQLSFLSVASILLYQETFNEQLAMIVPALSRARERIVRLLGKSHAEKGEGDVITDDAPKRFLTEITAAASVSMGAQILPTPFAVSIFHVFPLFGVLANLIIVPLTTIVLWLCMGASILAMFSKRAGMLFGYALLPITSLIDEVARVVSDLWISHFNLMNPTLTGMFFYYLSAAFVLIAAKSAMRKKRMMAFAGVAALLCALLWSPLRLEPMVSFLDVGHGDSIFVRSPSGRTMLVDAGDRDANKDMGKNVVAPFLWSNNARRIDYLVASHGDMDHVGGMEYILKNFKVGVMCVASAGWMRPHEKALLALCSDLGVPVRRMSAGELFNLDERAIVEVLSPPADLTEHQAQNESAETVNNNALVLRLRQDGVSILLPGDIQKEVESRLANGDCRASVLKVPHHGSKTSSTPGFIDAVSSSDCVISTGNRRGGESINEDVQRRYQERGIRIWRTDLLGGIRLRFHGDSATIDAVRPDRGYPYCAIASEGKRPFP